MLTPERIGTDNFDYTAVRHSKVSTPSTTRLSLSEFSFGVNKIVSASVKFTLGKKDGIYERDRSDYYEGVLDDARDMNVFLYDAKNRCAFHADAEQVILHIILHTAHKSPYTINDKLVPLEHLQDGADGHSVRRVMLTSADIVLKQDTRQREKEPATLLFRDKVLQLYDIIHGLQGHGTNNNIAFPIESTTTVVGWEYMDLVADKRSMKVKEAKLLKTCGNWPSFAADDDINGVILMGQDFGDVLQPAEQTSICASYSMMPKGKDYLGIQTSALASLYDDLGCSEDQEQLTSSGIAWHCPGSLFEGCQSLDHESGACHCDRIQEFVLPRNRFDPRQFLQPKVRRPGNLEEDGAVIFGLSGIKSTMFRRFGITSKKVVFEGDYMVHSATSHRSDFGSISEGVEEMKSLPSLRTMNIQPHGSVSNRLSQWHIPQQQTAPSPCASESSTCTESTIGNLTIFSTNGPKSRGQDSNSTSIPEASEQTPKTEIPSFTRPGVSFAAAASLPPYHWIRQPNERSLKRSSSSSVENMEKYRTSGGLLSAPSAIPLPPDTQRFSTTSGRNIAMEPKAKQEGHQMHLERVTSVIQDINLLKAPEWQMANSTAPSCYSSPSNAHPKSRGSLVSEAQSLNDMPYLRSPMPIGGAYQQSLRRKRNFIRQGV